MNNNNQWKNKHLLHKAGVVQYLWKFTVWWSNQYFRRHYITFNYWDVQNFYKSYKSYVFLTGYFDIWFEKVQRISNPFNTEHLHNVLFHPSFWIELKGVCRGDRVSCETNYHVFCITWFRSHPCKWVFTRTFKCWTRQDSRV